MDIDLHNWNNMLLIGDFVILFILKNKGKQVALNSIKNIFPVEYCLYGLDNKDKVGRIRELVENIEQIYDCKSVLVIKSDRIECIIDDPYHCFVIYTHMYKDIDDILTSQLIDCRCAGYDGTKVHSIGRFNEVINTYKNSNNSSNMSTEDYLRMLYYKEYGFKLHMDPAGHTLMTFDNTKTKAHSIGYIYKANMKFIDVLDTLTKYYKTLKLESASSMLLEYENSRIFYYYTKINYTTLYNNTAYDYLITLDDIDSLASHIGKSMDNKEIKDNTSDTSDTSTFTDTNKAINMEKVLTDNEIDDILSDKVQNINNDGYDLAGRSPLHLSLLYRSNKVSLYLYEDECSALDIYNDTNSVHILCKEGLTDLLDLPENPKRYLIRDEFGLSAYVYTLIFNRYGLFKAITDKFQDNVNMKHLLSLAIILKRKEIVMYILSTGFNINSKLIDEMPLHLSIRYGNLDTFNTLVNRGADLYLPGSDNKTPIRMVMNKITETKDELYKSMLNTLLDQKIDIKKDFFFEDLLEAKSEWVIDNIVARYSDSLDVEYKGQTLMHMVENEIRELTEYAPENNFVTSEITASVDTTKLNCMKYLRKLLEINNVQKDSFIITKHSSKKYYFVSFNGYKKDTLDEYKQYTNLFSSVWDLDFNRFKLILLEHKLDLDVKTSETNRTLFHICFEKDAIMIFKFIMELIRSSISNENKYEEYLKHFFVTQDNKNNLLLYAFKHNSKQCLDYLLNNTNDNVTNIVEFCLNDNIGFLRYALVNQNIELVSYLLRTNIIDELSSSKCSESVMNKIGINKNNLMLTCIQEGSLKSLFFMMTKLPKMIHDYDLGDISLDIFRADYIDSKKQNYLHHLCMTYYATDKAETIYNIVKMLHKMDTSLLNQKDYTGKTPLFYACVNKDSVLIQLLLQLGANTDVIDEVGWSPFHYLVSNDTFVDKKKISVFVRFNSTLLNSKTLYEKQTPLILAAKVDIPEYINTLIKLKVNTRSVDILGNMYTHYIMYNGSECAHDIKIDYHENNFGMTPLECLEIKIKKELSKGNLGFVSKIIDVYDKNSRIYTHRIICKKENMVKMRQNFIKLIDSKKLSIIQNLIMH